MSSTIKGQEVLAVLARRFPQLYVAPAEGAQEAHRDASGYGVAPEGATLDHFIRSDEDELREVDTPADPIDVVFLKQRKDFETFLQIIGHKSQPVPIDRTVGAITYRRLPDWGAVRDAHQAYAATGGDDWVGEFNRLARQPGMFRAEIIVISEGPYSNVPASDTPYSETEWVDVSREIRLSHECAHVVCRRTMPDDILPIWDEVTADVTGLLCATGNYDATLAARFFGITPNGYVGGRLTEYLDAAQKESIDQIASEVYSVLQRIEERADEKTAAAPFDFLLELKRNPLLTY